MYPSQLVEKETFIYSFETSFEIEVHGRAVHHLIEEYGMTYSAVIYLKENDKDYQLINKPCSERKETAFCFYIGLDQENEPKYCMKELMVDLQDENSIRNTVELLIADPHLRVLIAYGFGSSIIQFMENKYVRPHVQNYGGNFYVISFERSLTNNTI